MGRSFIKAILNSALVGFGKRQIHLPQMLEELIGFAIWTALSLWQKLLLKRSKRGT